MSNPHAVIVVRDKSTGLARLDDPSKASPAMMMALTRADRAHHGMWTGDLVRDAQGVKRVTVTGPNQVRAEEPLVAASQISVDGKIYLIRPRVDVPAGGTLTWRS